MSRLKIIILIVFVLIIARSADAYDILVVQSSRIKPYEDALQGIRSVVPAMLPIRGVKSVCPHTVEEIVLTDLPQNDGLTQTVRSFTPDLIIAIGHEALDRVKDFRQQPIVFLLVPFPGHDIKNRTNITGVGMNISPARQLAALIGKIPDIKRVGLVYDPEKTNDLVAEVKKVSREEGVTIVAREIHSLGTGTDLIYTELADGIDAFWLLPDPTVITPETLATLNSLAFQNKLPILAFADKYLSYGAAVSVSFDVYAMGEQVGEMVRLILTGTDVNEIPVAPAKKIKVKFNENLLKISGL